MKDLLIWIILWFTIWGVLNIYFRWRWERLKSKKYIPRGMFFIVSFLATYYFFESKVLLFMYLDKILIGLFVTNIVGILLSFDKNYYKSFIKDRFFVLFQTFNIFFQQVSILVAMLLLKRLMGNQYTDLYFGLFFMGIHLPLLLLPWAKLKYYILASCFFGGWLFSYLNFNYTNGIVFSFLIHYLLYVFEIYYLKDEEKI